MFTNYKSYKVSIKETSFDSIPGISYPKTANITFYDETGRELGDRSFGAADLKEVYKTIKAGGKVNLDCCYIPEFSLAAFRRYFSLDKKEVVKISGFSARNSFFESKETTDFSHSEFADGDTNFDGSHFAKGTVSFQGCVFGKGAVNFSNTTFKNGNIDFKGVKFSAGDFWFKNAVLRDGTKDFQDTEFGEGEVSFANTEFGNGDLLFINSVFNCNKLDFKVARISGGKSDFHYAIFKECEIIFERMEFGDGRLDFRAVDFGKGRVNFNRSVIGNGEVNFEGASSLGTKIQFKRVTMGAGTKIFDRMEMEDVELSFERTQFGDGIVTFRESAFKILSLKSCHLDHYFDFRVRKAELLDLSDTIVRDIIDLQPYEHPVDIKTLDISGMRLIGKIYISWRDNHCLTSITSHHESTLRQKAEQFAILKENFNATGKYEDEDNAYVMFKRYESRALLGEKKRKGTAPGIMGMFSYGFKWLVFDRMGLYATSPGRVLASVLLFWIFFGSLYYVLDITGAGKTLSSVGNPDHVSVFLQSFYHSAITFFTIGYGDVFPMGMSRLVSGIEGFIGVFMMSYFLVAFVRKVLR